MTNNPHLIAGDFQSDKYPWSHPGFVPLKTSDAMAQDLLAEYARRRRVVDPEFSDGLEAALRGHGFNCTGKRSWFYLRARAEGALLGARTIFEVYGGSTSALDVVIDELRLAREGES